VEEKRALMAKLGSTTVTIGLPEPIEGLPEALADLSLTRSDDGLTLCYVSHGEGDSIGIADIVRRFDRAGIAIKTIDMKRSSLEDIFVDLVEERA